MILSGVDDRRGYGRWVVNEPIQTFKHEGLVNGAVLTAMRADSDLGGDP
jgi:hypothetical protein